MNSKIKAQKITNWAALVVSIIAQVVGWIPTCYLFDSGDINAVGALFPAIFLIGALVFTVISFIFMLPKKSNTVKGRMIGKLIMVSIMTGLSGLGAEMGMVFVSREETGAIFLLACIAVLILNIVFTVKAANSIKTSENQQTYANQPAYTNQPNYANQPAYANPAAAQQTDFSDDIVFTENGKPVQ